MKISCGVLFFLLLWAGPTVVWAQSDPIDSSVVPYLNPTTTAVIRIDSSQLELADVVKVSDAANGFAKELISGLSGDMRWLKEKLEGKAMFVLIDIPFSQAQPPVRILLPKVSDENQAAIAELLETLNMTKPVWGNSFAVVTSAESQYSRAESVAVDTSILPINLDGIATAFSQVGDYPIQVVFVPPNYLWRAYGELIENVPEELGGGPMSRVTEGLQWAAMGFDPKSIDGQLIVQSATPAAAEAFAQSLPQFAGSLFKLAAGKKGSNLQVVSVALSPMLKTTVENDRIEIRLIQENDSALVVSTFVSIADIIVTPLLGRDVTNKLKQLGLAIHNYESAMRTLPPARNVRNAVGTSGLSWRVHILPYLGEIDLYNQFKINEPWDSEHNKQLLSQIPEIYRSGTFSLSNPTSGLPLGYTTLVAPVGEGTIFGGNEVVTFGKVLDGLSNTVMIVEVKPEFAVPWTSPDDYTFAPESPATGLLDANGNGFRATFGDASVRLIPSDTAAEKVLHLFQMNDGNAVSF